MGCRPTTSQSIATLQSIPVTKAVEQGADTSPLAIHVNSRALHLENCSLELDSYLGHTALAECLNYFAV
jgi:hypothetical protein